MYCTGLHWTAARTSAVMTELYGITYRYGMVTLERETAEDIVISINSTIRPMLRAGVRYAASSILYNNVSVHNLLCNSRIKKALTDVYGTYGTCVCWFVTVSL